MPTGFDAVSRVAQLYAAFARVKQLVADFRANEEFHVEAKKSHGDIATPDNYFQTIRSALTAEEIKIVEGQV
jgi:hypothetical protein